MTRFRPLVATLAMTAALAACDRTPKAQAPAPPPPAAPAPAQPSAEPQARDTGEKAYSQAYQACMASGDAAKGVTSAMADCVVNELEVEDGRLNAAYQKVIAGLDEEAQASLRYTQRAWIAERDRHCRAEAAGGTIDRINIPACVLDVTIARARELEAMAAAN